ncbi:NAD-dependent epimerase/dehydratase family protein [Actinokineospora sp. NPDC004072]
MRALVLGGTGFVGRAITADLLASGAAVTVFNRGRSAALPGVDRLIGDRETGDYAALSDGTWDAVVDVSGYVPRHVAQSMAALDGRVGRYLFISSHAVYAPCGPGSDEDSPRRSPVRDTEVLTNETYGPCKVACEDDILARHGDRATFVRAGKVAGPHDNQRGLTHWLRLASAGGRVEVPTDPRQPVQLIDVRDVARLVTLLLEADRRGPYNAVGPVTTLAELITTCAEVAGTAVEIARVAPAPAPLVRDDWAAQQRNPARARAAGMPVTPLRTTIADTLAWQRSCA